ncbi:hypothetical protein VP01_1312g2 [Puccinia sorghi]|uniref:TFIIS N-terminal domain-containing protein n=1 Tax=Puccinia sorghi TaxID=27349 RepID=A0A0L6VMX0_9BASI|nr:hypothetical protein VP01_1312g2 [Puccinia sorghi]
MQVSFIPPAQPVGLPPPSAELDPADPSVFPNFFAVLFHPVLLFFPSHLPCNPKPCANHLWRHVKTEWVSFSLTSSQSLGRGRTSASARSDGAHRDHQFVKRANFLPWLRAQLQIDPIDEASSAPEPLLCYVKRRFALAQNQQRLRAVNQSTSAPTDQPANAAVVQAPLNIASNAVGTSVETQASSLAAQDSCTSDTSRPDPSVSPESEGSPATYPASGVHDQVPSDASDAASNGALKQADVSSSSTYLTNKPPPSSSTAFSSQLGAIADAHMGHSSHMATASLSSTLNSQPGGLHSNSNGIHGPRAYPQVDENHSSDPPQQPQLSPSVPSSSYANHPTHSRPAFAHAATHPHLLQPPSVNQYSQVPQFMNVTPHKQFPDTHKGSSEHHVNSRAHGHQSFDFNRSAPVSKSGNCSSAPLLQIDPALTAGYETSYVLASQTSNQSVPVVSPAVNVAPVVIASRSLGVTSPRRTRSATALTNENQPAAIVPCSSVTEKLPPTKKRGPRSASSSIEDTSVETVPNLPVHNFTHPKEVSHKEGSNASSHLTSSPPADQYNRKAWKSRLASVRTELDQICKAPSRSASKLVKILSMYSISPTPTSGDWSTVPPEGRVEVLSAMKAGLPQDFYNTWVSESKGLAMLESWLKGCVHIQEKAKSKETSGESAQNGDVSQRESLLVNILQTLAKLPLTVENLKNHAFAKQVMRINKDQNGSKFSDIVKQLSIELEQKWRAVVRGVAAPMVRNGSSGSLTNPAVSTCDTKKRFETAPDSNQSKKRRIETTRIPVRATPSTNKNTNDLFGRPDKAKLPVFTKKILEPPMPPPVVQDTFTEAMGLLIGKNAVGTAAQLVPTTSTTSSGAGGKSSKRVRFVADDKLCQIKIVERVVYEGEDYETHPVGDARKMDAVEGRYLHQSDPFLEEEIEWEVPFEVVLTHETIVNLETSPLVSAELAAQEEREKVVAGVTYDDQSQIPHTPHEPSDFEPSTVGDSGSPNLPKLMKLGGDLLLDPEVSHLIAKAQADNSINAPVAPDHTVLDLLARLGGSGALSQISDYTSQATLHACTGFDTRLPPGLDVNLLNSISQSGSLQALLAASGNIHLPMQPASTTHTPDPFPGMVRDNGWGAAAGSASRGHQQIDASAPYIPTGPSAGVSRNKRRKKGKGGNQPRMSAHDSSGRHIQCKWWPDCPHGNKCFYVCSDLCTF